jgi:hypothetical protein
MHLTRGVISLVLLLAANYGGPASALYGQSVGWNGGWARMEDPKEHAFTLDVPRNWTASGGAYRLRIRRCPRDGGCMVARRQDQPPVR